MNPLHKSPPSYVLVLHQDAENLQALELLMSQMRYPMIVAHSLPQAIAKASQTAPCLIILTGNQQTWSNDLITQFRRIAKVQQTPIVALTDFHAPSWLAQEDNPGLDGFLVKPLNVEVLKSVMHSALVRQYCESF